MNETKLDRLAPSDTVSIRSAFYFGRIAGRDRDHRDFGWIAFAAVQAAREAARRSQCSNNLMQFGIALHNYEMAHRKLPPGTIDTKGPIVHLPVGFHHSWIVQILPMLDERVAYGSIKHSQSIYSPANILPRMYAFGALHCPSDYNPVNAQTNYAGVHDSREVPIDVTNNGVLFLNSAVRFDDIIDGASHTIFVGEKFSDATDLGWRAAHVLLFATPAVLLHHVEAVV